MDDEAVLVFDPPELVWRGVRLNKPRTTKLTITSRLNASLDLELKPAGSGRDRLRVLPPSSEKLTLPPRGSVAVEVEVAVDAQRFAPGPMRLKAAREGIRDALCVRGLYFDLKVPATWFLDETEVLGAAATAATRRPGRGVPASPRAGALSLSRSPAKLLPRLPAMPSPSPAKRRTIPAVRKTDGNASGGDGAGGHAPPASLSEDEEGREDREWGAPPSPPAPRDEAAAAAVAASSRSDPPFGAVEGPVEIYQAWLAGGGGVDGDGEEEEEPEGGGLEGDEEEDFALPPMPPFGSSASSPPAGAAAAAATGGNAASGSSGISPLRAVDELLSSQDRRARDPRQVLRAQRERGEEEEALFGGDGELAAAAATAAAATPPPPPHPPSRLHRPPATAVSRAAALEAVLAQQEGANAELRARVRELASALEEARASACAAESGVLAAAAAAAVAEGGSSPGSSHDVASADAAAAAAAAPLLLARERAGRLARDAAVLRLLRAKDDAFAALEVRAADASARASEERRARGAAEREKEVLAGRVRKLSAELARRDEGRRAAAGGGEGEGAQTAAAEAAPAAAAVSEKKEEEERELASSLRRALAEAEARALELERAVAEQRARASEATRAAEDAAGRAELLGQQLEAAVAAAGASASAPVRECPPSAAAAAAAAFSKYRQERHADALRLEAAVYSGLAALSSNFPSREDEEAGPGRGGYGGASSFEQQHQQHQQRLLLLSSGGRSLAPPLPPSLTAGGLSLAALEAALAVDGATSSSRELAVREATAAAARVARAAADEAARAKAKRKAKAGKEAAAAAVEAAAVEAAAERGRAAGLERELEERERALRELGSTAEELRERLATASDAGQAEREGGAEGSSTFSAEKLLLEAARCSLRSALRSAEAMRSAARACDDTAAAGAPGAPAAPGFSPPPSVEEAARAAGLSVEEAADLLGVGGGGSERATAPHVPPAPSTFPPLARVVASALNDAEVAAAAAAAAGGGGRREEAPSRRVAAAAEAVAREAAAAEGALADAVARLPPLLQPLSTVAGVVPRSSCSSFVFGGETCV